MITTAKKLIILLSLSTCLMGFQSTANAKTLVVQISSYNPTEAVHGLLFALHSLRDSEGDFGNESYDLTVKVLFNGEGVLNASNRIKHPQIKIETRPDDPKKTAKKLIKELNSRDVEMRATGFGLKQFGVDPTKDLLPGVLGGGANVVPRFIISPEDEEGAVVVNF